MRKVSFSIREDGTALLYRGSGHRSIEHTLKRTTGLVMAVLLFLPATGVAQKSSQQNENEAKDNPRARAEYLEQKRSGGAPVPAGARLRALEEVDRMMQREGQAYWQKVSAANSSSELSGAVQEGTAASSVATAISSSASQWTPIGPQATLSGGLHFSGRVTALAVDPNTPTTVYLGGAQGGIWKSTDSGANWTPLTDTQASLATGSMVVDSSGTIFVGTGEENFGSDSYYGAGVLRSTDGGSTWVQLGQTTFAPTTPECTAARLSCGGAKIGAIAIQPGTSGTSANLLVAVQRGFSNSGGLYWSTDGGSTWATVSGASGTTADSVVFINSTTAIAGFHNSQTQVANVLRCTISNNVPSCSNGLGTAPNTISTVDTERVSLAAGKDGATVYAAVAVFSTSALSGLYKSTDAGLNWTKLTVLDFCTSQCFYDLLVAVNPVNAANVFVGGSGFPNNNFLFHSVDGGATWIQDTTSIHADQHAAAFTPDGTKLYIGNDGGVYSTPNTTSLSEVTWTDLNSTLNITQFYGRFALHPTNSQITFGGTQDNGIQRYSGALAWDEVTCGDGASAVIDPNNPTTVFANCQDIDIRRSASGNPGSFGTQDNAGATILNSGDRVAFIPPLVGDASGPMKLYFGTSRLWQGTTATTPPTWSPITGDLTAGSGTITSIGISPDNSTAFVVTSDGRVSRIANLSGAPSANTVAPAGVPTGTQINAVTVVDANTAYIAVPGFTAGSHIFKTADGGVIWTNVTGSLPNTPANDIVVDPDLPNTLYVATDVGVFRSIDGGANWSTLQSGLPRVAVYGLKLHEQSRTLRAATHGRGMWDLSVPSCFSGPCVTLSPTGLNFNPQVVGTTSGTQQIIVTNSGTQTLNITSVSTNEEFPQTNTCGSVAPGATCVISVSFTPAAAFSRPGAVTILSNFGLPVQASLSGTGVIVSANDNYSNAAIITTVPYTSNVITNGATSQATDPIPPAPSCVTLFPADSLGYDPSSNVNHHSVWYFYTPATSGTVNMETSGSDYDTVLSVWTGSPGNFTAVSNGCNDDINPRDTAGTSTIQNISVSAGTTYRILVTGFYANESGNLAFHLTSGPATSVAISPSALSYSALIGTHSAPKTLTLTNTSGSLLTISNVFVSGDYSLSQNCTGGTIAVSATCAINITFAPTTTGQRNGVLTITDNASGSPRTIPITGTGLDFALTLKRFSRPSRSGGGAVVSGQSKTFELTLDSSGMSDDVVSLECAGAPPGATCTVEPARVTLDGASIPIQVRLQTAAGPVSIASSRRSRRLNGGGTPPGSYELQVNARVGDVVRSTLIPATVEAPNVSGRVKRALLDRNR